MNAQRWHKSILFVVITAVIAFLIIVFILRMHKGIDVKTSPTGTPLIPGEDEIYPVVMVNGNYYKWVGAVEKFSASSSEYMMLTHVLKEKPEHDGEFCSTFDADGIIYYDREYTDKVYIIMTTDWFENSVIEFQLIDYYALIRINGRFYKLDRAVAQIPQEAEKWGYSESIVEPDDIEHDGDIKGIIAICGDTYYNDNTNKVYVEDISRGNGKIKIYEFGAVD